MTPLRLSAGFKPGWATSKEFTLYMQPVQDLTVEDRISRTQYQYTMEDADGNELSAWAPKLVDKLTALPQLHDVASDQQDRGLQETITIDRDTASRLGILPQVIDDTCTTHLANDSIHDFHATESVSRGPRSGPDVPAEPDALNRFLCIRPTARKFR